MNIYFDVDGTIIAEHGSLRPHVREVFRKLKEAGHTIYIWSGVGIRWEVVRSHKLDEFVSGCFVKPLADHRQALPLLGIQAHPDFCVDDYDSVVRVFGGVTVRPYPAVDTQDTEMLRVLDAVLNGAGGTPAVGGASPRHAPSPGSHSQQGGTTMTSQSTASAGKAPGEYKKPLPTITPANQPYFDALKKHEFRLPKCNACGHIFYPPEPSCPKCLSTNLSWPKMSGKGKVWSFIFMHQRYFPSFLEEIPYNIVFVELQEGPWVCANLVGIANKDIKCDMPVEVVFDDVTPEITLAKFRPRAG